MNVFIGFKYTELLYSFITRIEFRILDKLVLDFPSRSVCMLWWEIKKKDSIGSESVY